MISQLAQNNLASWVVQVFAMATLGALLPLVFRIRDPKTQLAYTHLVLAVCLVLPWIQPWQHSMVFSDRIPSYTTLGSGLFLNQIALGILVAGFALRLGWLVAGMLRIRRYRKASTPLSALPESLRLACERVRAVAVFCVSKEIKIPATIGLLRPTVLLPESFLSLKPAWQHGIACHELLHVRRRDWFVTIIEEVVAAGFWFHPGVWWLLGQSRLAREQLVDAEVVRLTSARNEYIISLLTIAGMRLELDLAPAPLFLRRRHLIQRL